MTTLAFVAILSVLVFVHEMGHLLAAKAFGIKVKSFSVGFGPALFSFHWGETEYCLSLIPLGGYVLPDGPSFLEDIDPADPEKDRYAVCRPWWQKFIFALNGPVFNYLMAFAVLVGSLLYVGKIGEASTSIGEVLKSSPAAQAGFQKGDQILSINREKVTAWEDVALFIGKARGQRLDFEVLRNGKPMHLGVTPKVMDKRLMVGIGPEMIYRNISGLPGAVKESGKEIWDLTWLQAKSLGMMVAGLLSPKGLGGPVLIYQTTGEAVKAGWGAVIGLVVVLNIALGFFNLLPIPPLDGSHLVFAVIQKILGRPVGKKVHTFIANFGLALLLLLMAYVFYNDLTRI